jgi:4-amino-4-deoxy-L-arabinose transferase-like glycosyltransferase
LASSAILATAPLYIVLAHINTLDTVFSGTVGLTLACFWMAREAGEGRTARLWWYGAFASGALAVLAKGLAGIVLPGGAVFFYLLLSGEWKLLRRVPWVTATLLFLAVALPWHLLAAARNPDWAQFYIVREHFLRFTTTVHARTQPWWFFGPVLLGGFLPWSGLNPPAGPAYPRHWGGDPGGATVAVFIPGWAGYPVVFFSLSGSKLIPYVLPSFLPLAVLAGRALAKALHGGPETGLVRAGLLGGGLAPALLGLPFLAASVGKVERFSEPGAFFPLLFALSAATRSRAASSRPRTGTSTGWT